MIRFVPTRVRTCTASLFGSALLIASPATADVLYSYSNAFLATQGFCPDPNIEVEVVFDEAITPNTPLPSVGNDNPGRVSWSLSACGETCTSDEVSCGFAGGQILGSGFRFATDSLGVPDEWEVSISYQRVSGNGESIQIATTRRVGDGVEADLFEDTETGAEGVAITVSSWTVSEVASPVPASSLVSRIALVVGVLAIGVAVLIASRVPRSRV